MPVMKKPVSQTPKSIPAPLRTLIDAFFPADDLGLDSVAAPLMAAGKAAKGLVNGVKGFALPDGKLTRVTADGVHRITEGIDAAKALKKMEIPTARANRESGFVPSVSHASHLDDVKVPIADSLDTDMATGAASVGKWQNNVNPTAKRNTKINPTIVKDIRALYETGSPIHEINRLYPDLSQATISEVAKRLTWARVK